MKTLLAILAISLMVPYGFVIGYASGESSGIPQSVQTERKVLPDSLHAQKVQHIEVPSKQIPTAEKIVTPPPSPVTSAYVKNGTLNVEVTSRSAPQAFSSFGVLVGICVPLLVLLVTNLVTLWKIRLEAKAAIRNQLSMDSISTLKEQLCSFYDPILALLNTNSEIFNGFGPRTFPQEHFAMEEASHIWSLMVDDVILPNNKEVVKIIKSYSHLMHSEDHFDLYLRYMKHAASYDAFRNTPNQLHGDFSYPADFLPNVREYRQRILGELQKLQRELPG